MPFIPDKWITRHDDLSGTYTLIFYGDYAPKRNITTFSLEQMTRVIQLATTKGIHDDAEIQEMKNHGEIKTYETLEQALARGVTIQKIPPRDKKTTAVKATLSLEDIGL